MLPFASFVTRVSVQVTFRNPAKDGIFNGSDFTTAEFPELETSTFCTVYRIQLELG
jgi:hypothetical protein